MAIPDLIPEPTRIVSDGPPPVFRRFPDRPHAQPVAGVPRFRVSPHRVIAVVVWCIAVWTTWQTAVAVGIRDLPTSIIVALIAQIGLTVSELPLWQKRRDSIALTGLVIDVGINFGGVWPWMRRLDQTPTWKALAEVGNLDPGLALIPACLLSLIVAYYLAAAPERLWRRG